MKYRSLLVCLEVAACAWFASLIPVHAQGTAFTYQGKLQSNSVAVTGSYDLQFTLQQALTGPGQIGVTLTNAPVGVTNGLFTTVLDFGNVFGASPLYLEIGVRTNGSTNAYVILAPRQQLTSAPYAVQALTAANLTGGITDSQLPPDVALVGNNQVFTGTTTFSNANGNFSGNFNGASTGTFSGAASGTFSGSTTGTNTGKFIGDGSSISNLNVTNINGVIQSNPNWQLIATTSVTGVAGNNFLATNAALTTLTLPANPGIGTTLGFAGSGSAGWAIAQTGSQAILTAPLGLPAGQVMAQSITVSNTWHGVASSADGTILAGCYGTGLIYYSTNGGKTWAQSDAPSQNWSSISCSTNGMHMIAAPNNQNTFVYVSVNGGAHWVQVGSGIASGVIIRSVASSGSGLLLVAATGGGLTPIYASNNGGNTWFSRITGQNWAGVASSSDGLRIAAVTTTGQGFVSPDEGSSWTSNSVAGTSVTATGIASSADGGTLAVTVNPGAIYISNDSGVTWVPRASTQSWACVTSSADGRNLAAAYSLGFITTSTDGGVTWITRSNSLPSAEPWTCVASSADGTKLLAAFSPGYIYSSTAQTTPGTNGFLFGDQYSNVQLQYVGNNLWVPLSFVGTFRGN